MKTSYKLLSAAVLLVLFAIAVYNIFLIKVYRAQQVEAENARKDIYYNYEKMSFENFENINIQSGYVQIIQGPYMVYQSKASRDIMNVVQKGDELLATKNNLLDVRISQDQYDLIISCPNLESLKMNAQITHDKKEKILLYTYLVDGSNPNVIDIADFNQDSLLILQDNSSLVNLKNNKIGKLKAELGKRKGAGSMLRLDSTNQIRQADIDVREASKLILDNIEIPEIKSKFSHTARISITGKSVKMLKLLN